MRRIILMFTVITNGKKTISKEQKKDWQSESIHATGRQRILKCCYLISKPMCTVTSFTFDLKIILNFTCNMLLTMCTCNIKFKTPTCMRNGFTLFPNFKVYFLKTCWTWNTLILRWSFVIVPFCYINGINTKF